MRPNYTWLFPDWEGCALLPEQPCSIKPQPTGAPHYLCNMSPRSSDSSPPWTIGTRVHSPMLVTGVHHRGSGDSEHTVIGLSNAAGRITSAPFWPGDQEMIAGVRTGQVAQIIGEITEYQGKLQLKVISLRILPQGAVEIGKLVQSVPNPMLWWKRLDQQRGEVVDPILKPVLERCFDDPELRDRFAACPTELNGPGARLGGLLQHTVEVTAAAKALSRLTHGNRDLIIAGAILHDIGKIEAFKWHESFRLSEVGKLNHPATIGCEIVSRLLPESDGSPTIPDTISQLHHIILAQSPGPHWKTAVKPITIEALVVRQADRACTKFRRFQEGDDRQVP